MKYMKKQKDVNKDSKGCEVEELDGLFRELYFQGRLSSKLTRMFCSIHLRAHLVTNTYVRSGNWVAN